MEQDLDLSKYFEIARRRYLFVILPAAFLLVAAAVVAYFLPSRYESRATILIESQLIPDQLAASTVTASASERIKVIEQRLLARDNLLEIARKYSLYSDRINRLTPTEVVDTMRDKITIAQIDVEAASRRGTQVIGFTVSFEYAQARASAQVTNELVTKILSQNVETRLSRATETSSFFQQQISSLESRLLATEQKMAAFKRENEDALPETLSIRREELGILTNQIAKLDQEIQFTQTGEATTTDGELASADQLEFRRQSAQVNYDTLVKRRDTLKPLAEKGFIAKTKILDLDSQIDRAKIELDSVEAQMDAKGMSVDPAVRLKMLQDTRAKLSERADTLKGSIGKTPSVEVQLAAMARDYNNLQAEYNQTKAKLTEAQTGEQLEQDRQAERFEVIEQATIPEEPSSPNRPLIVLAGGAGGFGLGLALVLLLEFLDNSIRTSGDLERRLKVRAFAVIPYIETAYEGQQRKSKRLWYASGAVVAVIGVVAAVHILYLPLDLLVERGWEIIHSRLIKFV